MSQEEQDTAYSNGLFNYDNFSSFTLAITIFTYDLPLNIFEEQFDMVNKMVVQSPYNLGGFLIQTVANGEFDIAKLLIEKYNAPL